MNLKYFKKTIPAILITSFLLAPLSAIPQRAEAQTFAGYTSGLVPAITQLPLCRGKLTGATKYLFGQASEEAALDAELDQIEARMKAYGDASIAKKKLAAAQQEAQSQLDKIGVYDAEANKKIDELKEQLGKVEKSTASLDANDTCIQNIGRLVIKMLLQKITLSTVNWINSGFDGQPAFIQNTGKFFEDIAKNEILQFGLEINNPELFPFGKAWLQNQALSFNNKFTDNARYSLDEMIRSTTPEFSANSFQEDFSQGGWGVWSAMTQYPQNNPLGFQLMASDELQKRLDGTSQSTAKNIRDALEAADGFLGDQRCAEPEGMTREEDEKARDAGNLAGRCKRWEYVTPGSLIAKAATDAIGYPTNNLLKAEDLNDAFAAVADALLSHYTTKWTTEGFAKLGGEQGADGTFIYNPDVMREDYSTQTEKDFSPEHLTSSWIAANPRFNIRTGLTQALIDEQRTYADKLVLQNKELNSTVDGKDYKMEINGISNAYGLMPSIAQLDYCVPGPHIGWEEDSRRVLDAVTDKIIPETVETVKNKDKEAVLGAVSAVVTAGAIAGGAAIGATMGSVFPVVGTIIGGIIGAGLGALAGFLFGDDDAKTIRQYYAGIIQGFTGVMVNWESDDSRNTNVLYSKQGTVQSLNIILERYIDIMHLVYNPKILPAVYKEANREFSKLQGYAQIIANNQDKIADTKNIVNTLTEIKNKIDSLNARYPDGGEAYENELKPLINAFGRISSGMVNGDDIASADDLLRQIVDERNYIYKDLLKGPLGCEKDLELAKQNMPAQLYQTKRMNYPFPILYTYDMGPDRDIPDPFPSISGLSVANKTNIQANNTLGPGFLSYYSFQRDWGRGSGVYAKEGENYDPSVYTKCRMELDGKVPWCNLLLVDVIPMDKTKLRNLGTTPNTTSGPWENTIRVY